MHVDSSTVRSKSGKAYTRHLIRQAYRDEEGKPRQRTIANISKCSSQEIDAIKLALKHKGDLTRLASLKDVGFEQGLSVGAVWVLWSMARELGLVEALGNGREGKLALWQVMARIIDQGSRLSAVRLAGAHAACDVLGLEGFCEDDLYANLDWLCAQQADIEARLFRNRYRDKEQPKLFLYDVTSSYFEGMHNELAAFGYNRDGKRGKKQIVIGLLCDEEGLPLSTEVFEGNTSDPKTFLPQVRKARERFGAESVTFVGDRGMIKGPQIDELPEGCHYITAITKPQIEKLLKAGTIQMELFDQDLAATTLRAVPATDAGVRYVLRRNPLRADEIAASRRDKLASVGKLVADRNHYLAEHRRARVETALRAVEKKIAKLKLAGWVQVAAAQRTLSLSEDAEALAEESKLDGCYVIKTDLDKRSASKETVHGRYKDLAQVEWAFRTSKTTHLECRPIHVRLATRTRGHVFVVMLAYRIVGELARRWQSLEVTVQEGLDQLASLCTTKLLLQGEVRCHTIPKPRPALAALLTAAGIELPDALPSKGVVVTTRKKLTSRRKKR
ncbi:MAG: IS1634 family transposase [Planctomycetes bacterium]|nr:IS1634 family transposase [Planctomycetota bacterium]